MEVTVVMTEKSSFQRELERINRKLIRTTKDFNDLKVQNNLRIDEINKIQKQNQEYRSLLLEYENQLSLRRTESIEL